MIFRRLFLLFTFASFLAAAEKSIPFLSGPVIDDVKLLNSTEVQNLSEFIRSQKDLVQMQVWITSLEGESIEGLSYRAAKQWALGTEQRDNGILLLVAPAEKRMRFEVGRGLEGDVPDILAGRVLDYVARPNFREGRFYSGIRESLNQVVVLVAKGPQAEKLKSELSQNNKKGSGSSLLFLFVFFIVFISIFGQFFQRRFYRGGRHGWYSGTSHWGGGGGWSGGGGGWSGGGGSFGGGGSSSSW